MQLRQYMPGDWPEVCSIYEKAKPQELAGVVPERHIPALADDMEMVQLLEESKVIVLEVEGSIVAFAGYKGQFISWLFVHPDARRQGVASRLLAEVLERIGSDITLNVIAENKAARALYGEFGFRLIKDYIGEFRGHPCPVAKLRFSRNKASLQAVRLLMIIRDLRISEVEAARSFLCSHG